MHVEICEKGLPPRALALTVIKTGGWQAEEVKTGLVHKSKLQIFQRCRSETEALGWHRTAG